MASRPAILATLLGASIGVPYVVSQATGEGDGSQPHNGKNGSRAAYSAQQGVTTPEFQIQTPMGDTPVYPLAEALRLDITKEWVYARWPRKSTGLADPELFGVRVPLVTGTGIADLAGSLSYYFNAQGRVQHLSFRGRTGDPSQLVCFVTRRYGFRPSGGFVRPGEQLYQVMHNGKVQSELRTMPVPVLKSSSPHHSYMVELELERPGSQRYIQRPPPPLTVPATDGGEAVPLTSDPPKPVPVGPVSLLQTINNSVTGAVETVVPPSPSKTSTSESPTPVDIPRPTVRWPG